MRRVITVSPMAARLSSCRVASRDQRIKTTDEHGPICEPCHQHDRPQEVCAGCGRTRVLTRSRDDGHAKAALADSSWDDYATAPPHQ